MLVEYYQSLQAKIHADSVKKGLWLNFNRWTIYTKLMVAIRYLSNSVNSPEEALNKSMSIILDIGGYSNFNISANIQEDIDYIISEYENVDEKIPTPCLMLQIISDLIDVSKNPYDKNYNRAVSSIHAVAHYLKINLDHCCNSILL